MKLREKFTLIVLMIVVAGMTRLIPHWPNFTAVGAMALFGGAYLSRKWALIVPVAALFVSDLFLNNLIYAKAFPEYYTGFMFFDINSLWIYGAFILVVLLGLKLLSGKKTIARLAVTSLSASAVFFLITNFSVWIGSALYPKTLAGLALCFEAGIPFFWNTLAGDLFFVTVLFGGYALVRQWRGELESPAAID